MTWTRGGGQHAVLSLLLHAVFTDKVAVLQQRWYVFLACSHSSTRMPSHPVFPRYVHERHQFITGKTTSIALQTSALVITPR